MTPLKKLHVNGVDMSVLDEGAGRPIVLVHGFPLDHSIWEGQIAELARHGRVIAPDLRGFGASEVSPGTVAIEQFADDLDAMLNVLGITEPIVLVGLSMGGYVAFEFWEKHRAWLRGIVLCDSRAAADTPEAAAGRLATADRVEREGTQVLVDSMLPRMLAPETHESRPDVVERLRRMILSGNAPGLAAAARGLAGRSDFTSWLPHIDCPTLLVVGKQDAISTPAEMSAVAAAIPGARLVEIDGAGHMAPLEKPAEVSAALLEFLAAIGGRSGTH